MADVEAAIIALLSEIQSIKQQVTNLQVSVLNIYAEWARLSTAMTAKATGKSLTSQRKEELIRIAIANGGQLEVKKQIGPMVEQGLFATAKHYRTQIYAIIDTMDCWKKVEPGQYFLLDLAAHAASSDAIGVDVEQGAGE